MEPAISKYKLTPPATEKIVPRLHLIDLLKCNQSKRLSIILGQAAQGKSTLAAAFFSTVEHPKAWVNLGEEDAEPVSGNNEFIVAILK